MHQIKAVEFKSSDVSDRTFRGYASTWDEDRHGDVIHMGAFKKTIQERGSRIKVLFNHNEPIGVPVSMHEDSKGLFVEAKISKTRLGDEVLELMRDGVIDQMSIGFSIPQGKSTFDDKGIRHIHEVKLYEFSPVTFPANESAIITGVKSLTDMVQIAQSKGIDTKELKAALAEMLKSLEALDNSEPSNDTPNVEQPLNLAELFDSVKSLGDFARSIRS
jgi:HK97 family phage prohead protease